MTKYNVMLETIMKSIKISESVSEISNNFELLPDFPLDDAQQLQECNNNIISVNGYSKQLVIYKI